MGPLHTARERDIYAVKEKCEKYCLTYILRYGKHITGEKKYE
jgi:hypothetical protein